MEERVCFIICPTGVDPRRGFIGPTFKGLLHKVQAETGFSISWGPTLFVLNAGLMKPRKGFIPVIGK